MNITNACLHDIVVTKSKARTNKERFEFFGPIQSRSVDLVSKLNLFFRFKVESAHCGGCHTMVRARPIPGYVYESSEEGTNTPITNGDEVILWLSKSYYFF